MLGGIADGVSRISNFLDGADCRATIGVMRALGIDIETKSPSELVIRGKGLFGLAEPAGPLDCDNSGTTMRLMAGMLAGQHFASRLIGTEQLESRPMSRIIDPLVQMGAEIRGPGGKAPLDIVGVGRNARRLKGIEYETPVASAQVKSCLLLAGLYADGPTVVLEKGPSRDHTERMLSAMGASVSKGSKRVAIEPENGRLDPLDMAVPGDISSAAFLMAAAGIVPGSEIAILGVGTNPTRTGIVGALLKMGADIKLENEREVGKEPAADITVRYAELKGADFGGEEIVTMIDEIPILAVAASLAKGKTTVRDAKELRVKETDRIATTALELGRLGARITPIEDGMIVDGGARLQSGVVDSLGDHRLAMMLAIAGLVADGETIIENAHVVSDSFPGFEACLTSLGAPVEVEKK
jgi:3-phosphoshikimate 1-carboxyvinyltransferase